MSYLWFKCTSNYYLSLLQIIKTLIEEHVDKCLSSQQQEEEKDIIEKERSLSVSFHSSEKNENEKDSSPKSNTKSELKNMDPEKDRRPLAERVRPSLLDEIAVFIPHTYLQKGK